MGAAAHGRQHQQTRAKEQPSGGARRAQVVRRVRHATSAFQIYDVCANAYYSLRYVVSFKLLLLQKKKKKKLSDKNRFNLLYTHLLNAILFSFFRIPYTKNFNGTLLLRPVSVCHQAVSPDVIVRQITFS